MDVTLNDTNFEKEINLLDKLVLVDFFAVWCGPCTVLEPILERVAEQFKEKIVLMKANLDDIPMTAQKFGVERIPTVVLFKDGKPINGFVGLVPENSIVEWLKNIIENKSQQSNGKQTANS